MLKFFCFLFVYCKVFFFCFLSDYISTTFSDLLNYKRQNYHISIFTTKTIYEFV